MKPFLTNCLRKCAAIALLLSPLAMQGQQAKIQNLRAYDQSGINVFETPKETDVKFDGLKVRFGAGFTQQFQAIKSENPGALNNGGTSEATAGANKLYPLKPGFMTAQANLFMDVQLAEGIRLNLTSYLSSRHHNETWVKGGYIQFDKLPFKGQFWDNLMKVTTVKVGHFELNYGDAHYRRPDGGHTLYSPFMEGNIMDAFATEIGGEVYVQKNGLFGMVGVTNGMIKGNIDTVIASADGKTSRKPSVFLKAGIDKQVTENVRLRLSGSYYHNGGNYGSGLTLYSGDRTGSNYQNAFDQWTKGAGKKQDYSATFSSGRFNPGFSNKIDAVMVNGFAKVYGFEFFGTYESANGRSKTETKPRHASQYAVEGIYRIGKEENLFLGVRYNAVKSDLVGYTKDVEVNRFCVAGGWFITKNVLMKAEVVKQEYNNFLQSDYRYNGKFNGFVLEAVVGF